MNNFLSRTSFGLEGQIRTFNKKGQGLQFVIFGVRVKTQRINVSEE